MKGEEVLTSTSIIGGSVDILVKAGYREITPIESSFWESSYTRLFEDANGIVCLVVYETYDDLLGGWKDAQMYLVELITRYVSRTEPKVWDSYLLLLTPSSPSNELEVDKIRYDTTRTRKIIATGRELTSHDALENIIAPLLPLQTQLIEGERGDVLTKLPILIEDSRGIQSGFVQVIIDAFRNHKSMVEELHNYRRGS